MGWTRGRHSGSLALWHGDRSPEKARGGEAMERLAEVTKAFALDRAAPANETMAMALL